MISVRFQGKSFNITVIEVCVVTTDAQKAKVDRFYEDLGYLLGLTPKKDALSITGDWNAKVGSLEITKIASKFGLGVQNEAGQRLTEFCQENTLVRVTTLFPQHKNSATHGHHQLVNTKSRLIYSEMFLIFEFQGVDITDII